MKFREGAVIEAISGADIFLGQYKEKLARDHPAEFEHAQQLVADVLARLRAHAVEQNVGARCAVGETARQRKLRIDICKEWLRPIARIARDNLHKVPEYAALQAVIPTMYYTDLNQVRVRTFSGGTTLMDSAFILIIY